MKWPDQLVPARLEITWYFIYIENKFFKYLYQIFSEFFSANIVQEHDRIKYYYKAQFENMGLET